MFRHVQNMFEQDEIMFRLNMIWTWSHVSEHDLMFQNMIPCSRTWNHVQHQKPLSEHDFMFRNMISCSRTRFMFLNIEHVFGTRFHVLEHEIMFQNMISCSGTWNHVKTMFIDQNTIWTWNHVPEHDSCS